MTRNALRAMITVAILLLGLFGCSAISAQRLTNSHHDHHTEAPNSSSMAEETQDWAKSKLAKSSRHQEWVKIKQGTREVHSFVVYPEVKAKATAVIVIHEINGLTDWVQSLADQLAEAGYIAIAPDLLSGMGTGGGGTSAFSDRESVGKAIRDLPPDQITADLDAVAKYVAKLPAANGKVVVSGFCWGGAQTFRYATNNRGMKAAFVFYGSPPMKPDQTIDSAALARIEAPVYGFYAGNDARINATLPATIAAMNELKKFFEPVTYEGAGHGFMRAGDAPEPKTPDPKGDKAADEKAAEDFQKALVAYKANKKARDEAWLRWKSILKQI